MSTIAPPPLPTLAQSSCSSFVVRDSRFDPRMIDGMGELKSLSHHEGMIALYEYARRAKGSVIEIGTYCGYTAIGMAFGIRNREEIDQIGAQVYTVDTHTGVVGRDRDDPILAALESRHQPATFQRYVQCCKRYNVWDLMYPIIDDSSHAWRHWRGDPAGMLFIDGDHEQCLRDFEQWSPLLRDAATVCFHDYWNVCPQVVLDVDHLVQSGRIMPLERVQTLFIARLAPRKTP